jgi:hypothetical protein
MAADSADKSKRTGRHFVTKTKHPKTKESTASDHGNSSSTSSDDPGILSITEHVSSVQQKTRYRSTARRMRENCR